VFATFDGKFADRVQTYGGNVGVQGELVSEARWLACTIPVTLSQAGSSEASMLASAVRLRDHWSPGAQPHVKDR